MAARRRPRLPREGFSGKAPRSRDEPLARRIPFLSAALNVDLRE